MYKFYIVILLTVIINNGFTQNKIQSKLYISAGSGINYPVYNGLNGSKFNVPLIIELGIQKENDWFFEIDYSWGKEKERTEYYKNFDSTVSEYYYSEVNNKFYTIHIGTRFYLTNGPFVSLSAGWTSRQLEPRHFERTNINTGEKYISNSSGYGFNSVTFFIGLGKEFELTKNLTLFPQLKAVGSFYSIIPYFYSSSAIIHLRYTFIK